jgi:hypothetical protein
MNLPWYWPKSTGVRAVWESIQVATGMAQKEDLPGPALKCQGFRLEELVRMFQLIDLRLLVALETDK